LIAAVACALASAAWAQGQIVRTELNRADLTGSDTLEVIVARLLIEPGATVPPHYHNGDEHLIVIEGGPLQAADGTRVEFDDGVALSFPRGKVHGGLTSISDAPIVLYTTHIVDKGKPLNMPPE
jgi:quercetin dioxygenase-like cupin family protein